MTKRGEKSVNILRGKNEFSVVSLIYESVLCIRNNLGTFKITLNKANNIHYFMKLIY